jgi:hypothetical protein
MTLSKAVDTGFGSQPRLSLAPRLGSLCSGRPRGRSASLDHRGSFKAVTHYSDRGNPKKFNRELQAVSGNRELLLLTLHGVTEPCRLKVVDGHLDFDRGGFAFRFPDAQDRTLIVLSRRPSVHHTVSDSAHRVIRRFHGTLSALAIRERAQS